MALYNYHVLFSSKTNIRNQKTPQIGRLPKIEYERVSNEIKELHMCLNKSEFEKLKSRIFDSWKNQDDLKSFHD